VAAISTATFDAGSPLLAVLAGAETGVELADALSEVLLCRSNGTAKSSARRNKDVMQDAVRAAGVRAVTHAMCHSEKDVIAFWQSLSSTAASATADSGKKCVIKPTNSAGSDSVFLCESEAQAITAFNAINGYVNRCLHPRSRLEAFCPLSIFVHPNHHY
jgi:biotin carboxylase